MKYSNLFVFITFTLFANLLSGCSSSTKPQQPWCAIGGGTAGALLGMGIHAATSGSSDDLLVPVAIGAPTGAIVGSLLCPTDNNSTEPEIVAKSDSPILAPIKQNPADFRCSNDQDNDGISGDGSPSCPDKCPNTPHGVLVDADGCPKVGQTLLTLPDITFPLDSYELNPSSKGLLENAVNTLRDTPNAKIRISGHTDNLGTERYNIRLSSRRANSVLKFMTRNGISPDRLDAVGYGETRPIANNKTEDGRSKNRRVEFVVVSKG